VEYLVLCLESICGHWLRAGEALPNPGVLMAPRPAKAQASPPRPGYHFGEKLQSRDMWQSAAGMPTPGLPDEMLLDGPGRVQALLSCGGNPVTAWPDVDKTVRALRSLDLLVQIDPWMRQTSRLAHYVIAPKIGPEIAQMSLGKDWTTLSAPTYGSEVPFGQYAPALVDPPAGSDLIEEWEFFYGVATRLGLSLDLGVYHGMSLSGLSVDMSVKPTTDQLFEVMTAGSRIPFSEVKRHPHGAVFADPPQYVQPKDPDCQDRLQLGHPDMMADLALVAQHQMRQGPITDHGPQERAFRLISRRMMHVYNSSWNDPATNHGRGYNPAFMHPQDIQQLDLKPGDPVEIQSDHCTVTAIVEEDPNVRPGVISMSAGFGEIPEHDDLMRYGTNVNRLLSNDKYYDRYSGEPLMSNVPVDVHPLNDLSPRP
jgi:anaerobic selenocysteine-containing dehydrogenase